MSYLQFPRLIFSGQFQADAPTANNDPLHFDNAKAQTYDSLPNADLEYGWFNPKGTGAWRFKDCVVQQVQYLDGTICDKSEEDPVVGLPINNALDRVEGKIADLDVDAQRVAAIWGFQVFVGTKSGSLGFGGDFEMAPYADIWRRNPNRSRDGQMSAMYQSVIALTKQIVGATDSRFLKELSGATNGGRLSIKFTVDDYELDATQEDFTFGRVTGSIGAYHEGEPTHYLIGRTIFALSTLGPSISTAAYAIVEEEGVHLDVGNFLPMDASGRPAFDDIALAIRQPGAEPVILGKIASSAAEWYEKTAGILYFKLTAAQRAIIDKYPLQMVQFADAMSNRPMVVLGAEPLHGEVVRADQFVFRFNPTVKSRDPQTVRLYATKFGKPLSGATVYFQLDGTLMTSKQPGPKRPAVATPHPATAGNPNPPYPLVYNGKPMQGGSIYTLKTDGNGVAHLVLGATDPGNPRGYIDGQVFGIAYGLGAVPIIASGGNQSSILNIRVFNQYEVPKRPTWIADVQPIFQQYANMYPVMKRIVDLGNFGSVMRHLSILRSVFKAPESHPNYMPVTRDLSKAKREMLLKWLDHPLYMDIESVEQLKQALQIAIELEHGTIPIYLTAMYSIKPGTNAEVMSLIRGVVVEEMLHMSLVCNILIAIGGSPAIGQPGFVPRYPGPLPGGLRSDLTASLKKCSIEHIRDCFMAIEMPTETILERMRWLDPLLDAQLKARGKSASDLRHPRRDMTYAEYTIGWFYDEVKRALIHLSKKGAITFGNVDQQVTAWSGVGQLFAIEHLDDAIAAIDEIKEQGEGVSAKNLNDGQGELSHYYKFAEIVEGQRLVFDASKGWTYTGAKIPFNPDDVWPMVDNPGLVFYPEGSRAALLAQRFAEGYQAVLNSLHTTFNGHPQYLSNAVSAMYALGLQAAELLQTPSGFGDGTHAGPQYIVDFR